MRIMKDNKKLLLLIILASILLMGNDVITISEDSLPALLDKAAELIDHEEYQDALTIYKHNEQLINGLPKVDQARIYNNMGYCAFRLEKPDRAAQYYQKALELNNEYVKCLNNMAALLMGQNRHKDAIVFLMRADAIDQKNIKVIFNLAVCFGYQKNEFEVLTYMKRAFELNEDYTCRRLKKRNISDNDIRELKERIQNLNR